MAKRTEATTTTALRWLADIGFKAGRVDRQLRVGHTEDFLGIADIVGVRPSIGDTIAVQVTAQNHVAGHEKKILQSPNLFSLLECGWRVELWGIRTNPDMNGSWLKARTFVGDTEKGIVRVVSGSLVLEV